MRLSWLSALVLPVIAFLGLIQMSDLPREQTTFLERIAGQITQAQTIPPETERRIRETIRSIRRAGPPGDEALEVRQRIAIQRIEDTLWNRTGTLDSGRPELANGARRHSSASEEADATRLGKPLRPLYPFQLDDPREESRRIETR